MVGLNRLANEVKKLETERASREDRTRPEEYPLVGARLMRRLDQHIERIDQAIRYEEEHGVEHPDWPQLEADSVWLGRLCEAGHHDRLLDEEHFYTEWRPDLAYRRPTELEREVHAGLEEAYGPEGPRSREVLQALYGEDLRGAEPEE